ncbi:uncharacterized protein PADG_11910 [Paracoccidioides brasiliensis Pb18]|uniref:Uncharacterized protein n=1 Tax=Paracoccidioides brasiliensis (strain Pb18) TaxID=502780 RepID=A0A0A0HX01_PARBD|nr:uncharacterized protein PADG_11910 [Paracoccidioides brasiliensis Pb18]KGM91935.1 hypothetical protein PADG_11910 [Paracoccidioides brasiliensis Pb18]
MAPLPIYPFAIFWSRPELAPENSPSTISASRPSLANMLPPWKSSWTSARGSASTSCSILSSFHTASRSRFRNFDNIRKRIISVIPNVRLTVRIRIRIFDKSCFFKGWKPHWRMLHTIDCPSDLR